MTLGAELLVILREIFIVVDKYTRICEVIKSELAEFNRLFDATMSKSDGLLGRICQGIAERKGKLMRPMLLLLVAKEWGAVKSTAFKAALTLELLHTASLVHDDIVDDSDMRRGRPSVRSIYGNKAAVLAGDYLLSTALESVALCGDIEIVSIVSHIGKQLSEGELLQLFNTQDADFSEERYYNIIRLKTASLFSAATRIGAITAGAGAADIERMTRLGDLIGLCFQIRDDIFDYYNDDIGKPSGNDMREGKLTLPARYLLNTTADSNLVAIAAKVREGSATADEIAELVLQTKQQGGIDYAIAQMERMSAEAQSLIADLKNTEVREALSNYIDFISERRS